MWEKHCNLWFNLKSSHHLIKRLYHQDEELSEIVSQRTSQLFQIKQKNLPLSTCFWSNRKHDVVRRELGTFGGKVLAVSLLCSLGPWKDRMGLRAGGSRNRTGDVSVHVSHRWEALTEGVEGGWVLKREAVSERNTESLRTQEAWSHPDMTRVRSNLFFQSS